MTRAASFDFDRVSLVTLLAWIQDRTGLSIPAHRVASCEPAIRQAMARVSVADLDRLREVLDADRETFDAFIDALTIGETYFFRDPRQFAFLREQAIPDLLRRRSDDSVLATWSAGCASGEEPYSLAILLHEMGLGNRRRILGTDISRRRLAAARRGRYGRWSLRGAAPAMIDRYFRRSGPVFELDSTIRAAVRFEYLNLASDAAPALGSARFDVIVCRNVLIYFDPATVKRVASLFVDRLAEGGWLVLGPSDPPLPNTLRCEVVMTDAGLAYRRGSAAIPFAMPGVPQDRAIDFPTAAPVSAPQPRLEPADRGTAADAVPARALPAQPRESAPAVNLDALKTSAQRSFAARAYADAAAEAQVYLRRGGNDEDAWLILVRAFANAGRTNDAALWCAAALEAHPVSAELMVMQSLILTELGQHDAALAAARRALFLDRGLIVAHLACGSATARSGDRRAARRAFTNALRLLERLAPDAAVPASGDEPAARLMALAESQLRMLASVAP